VTNRVLWSEGLFLRPQHFQQQDRATEALVHGALRASHLQPWGFSALALDSASLDVGRVAIASARGLFPDGTPFAIPETMDPPEPLAIARDGSPGPVLLALPVEASGGASFDPVHAEPSGARYRGVLARLRDAVRNGADPEEIELARPVPLLLLPGAPAGGYTTLPVAEPDSLRADGSLALADGFLPPAVAAGAVPFYARLLQEIVTGLDRVAEAHGEMVRGGAGRSVEHLLVLELANAAGPRLAHMAAEDLFHPSEIFRELAGLAGRMATYGSGSRRLSALPPYDHASPGPAFAALADTLRALILTLRYVEPKSRALPVVRHATNIWKIRVDNPEILATSRIVLRVGSDLSEDALRRIFSRQATVGSPTEFEALWRARLPGIPLKPLHSQPREIPYDGDRLCLELDRQSAYWDALRDAPGFVLGVSGVLESEPRIDCYAVQR